MATPAKIRERTQAMHPGAHAFILEKLGYEFISQDLLAEALDASGRFPVCGENNKRLALFGDKFASAAAVHRWYSTGEKRVVGQAALEKQSNVNWALLAKEIGLVHYLTIDAGANRDTAAGTLKTLATAMEAIMGAIYLDTTAPGNGIVAIQAVLLRLGI